MRKHDGFKRFLVWPWLVMALFLAPAVGMAQSSGGLSSQDMAQIRGYTLNQDVVSRLAEAVKAGKALHLKKAEIDMSRVHSLDDVAKQMMAADPRAKPLLAKYGFSPREFMLASMAVTNTVMGMRYAEQSGQAAQVEAKLNPGNVAFYKAHKQEMDALMASSTP